MEREVAGAVVIKRKHDRTSTMNARLCAVVGLIQILAGPAFAANEKPPAPPAGLFQGTPEEQAACAPDSTRFCQDAIPDTFRVLACLQEHRQKLRKVCLKVLEDHGQ
jgi:hypothetical protein